MKNLKHSINLLGFLFFFIFFTFCNNKEKEIKDLIDQVYNVPKPYRNYQLIEHVFSKDLKTLILEAKEVEKQSFESIPENERNNIKPHIMEGEIFASLYEGYVSYSITKISIEKDSCVVTLQFKNDLFGSTEIWTDEVILVEENGWKLDNVNYFYKRNHSNDLKNLLSNFGKE